MRLYPTKIVTLIREVQVAESGWCWRGLCLGKTPFDEAQAQIQQNGAFSDLINVTLYEGNQLTWEWKDNENRYGLFRRVGDGKTLASLSFAWSSEMLTLGEVVYLFGTPQSLSIRSYPIGYDEGLEFLICFEQHVCALTGNEDGVLRHISHVHSLIFGDAAIKRSVGMPWRGFTRYEEWEQYQ